MGSDAWLTQEPGLQARLNSTPLFVLDGVRFALTVLAERASTVRSKRQAGEPLTVAAVYPDLARQALGSNTNILSLTNGGLEALPKLFPELDGTFDLVESGQTALDNDLVIIEDNLVPVTLDAVWSATGQNLLQSNLKEST
jgi:ATP phosphoribosyltransferase